MIGFTQEELDEMFRRYNEPKVAEEKVQAGLAQQHQSLFKNMITARKSRGVSGFRGSSGIGGSAQRRTTFLGGGFNQPGMGMAGPVPGKTLLGA